MRSCTFPRPGGVECVLTACALCPERGHVHAACKSALQCVTLCAARILSGLRNGFVLCCAAQRPQAHPEVLRGAVLVSGVGLWPHQRGGV